MAGREGPYKRDYNSTGYVHPNEENLNNLHKAMEYSVLGKPVVRTATDLDSNLLSGFNRQRYSGTRLLGEFRNTYGTYGSLEILTKFENGGSQTVNLAQTHTLINVTTTSGSRALRQSRQYHPYIPGTTIFGIISFTFGTAKANLQQMVGLYDDNNGIFLRMNGTTAEMVIRKGGIDTQIAPQNTWNIDRLDGNGTSGLTLDWTKIQGLIIDYQWLAIGRVRLGFELRGEIVYCHYFDHGNTVTDPYTYQPSLPVRWEIRNNGATDSNSSMMCVAYGIYLEGVDFETGFENSVSSGTAGITITSTTPRGILAVRLKNTVNGIPVKAFARIKEWQILTDQDSHYHIMILPDSTNMVGPITWNSISPYSWCEYATNFGLVDPTVGHTVFEGYATGVQNRSFTSTMQSYNRLTSIYQNYDSTESMVAIIVAYKMAQNPTVYASFDWLEIK